MDSHVARQMNGDPDGNLNQPSFGDKFTNFMNTPIKDDEFGYGPLWNVLILTPLVIVGIACVGTSISEMSGSTDKSCKLPSGESLSTIVLGLGLLLIALAVVLSLMLFADIAVEPMLFYAIIGLIVVGLIVLSILGAVEYSKLSKDQMTACQNDHTFMVVLFFAAIITAAIGVFGSAYLIMSAGSSLSNIAGEHEDTSPNDPEIPIPGENIGDADL